jgi:spermidine synthase
MSLPLALSVAALSGFIALSYEILWYRTLSYATASAPWVFGALLGAYLTGVALAAFGVERLSERRPVPTRRDVAWVALFVFTANAAGYLVVPTMAALAARGVWVASLALLGLSAGLLGAVLPLASHFAVRPDERVGPRLSYIYFANIVGCAAGSAVTGYVLLELFALQRISVGLAVAGAALAASIWLASRPALLPGALGIGAAAILAVLAVAAAPALFDRLWENLHPSSQAVRNRSARFAAVIENRHGVIAVNDQGTVFGGGAYDGAFSVDPVGDANGISRAYALAALHPAPREVLVIGLGSGSWAWVIANLPGVENVTIVEINPGYLPLIRRAPSVAPLLEDRRVEIIIDDGRRWLARHPERRFDAIVANVTLHWRANATNLLSQEFIELARSHLAPGGLYYFNSTGSAAARDTALAAFRSGIMVGNFVAVSDRLLSFDGERLRAVLSSMRIGGSPVVDPAISGHRARLEALATSPHPTVTAPVGPARVTDDNMLTEWGFGR